jgi:long-chain acyl-CoA synthetase
MSLAMDKNWGSWFRETARSGRGVWYLEGGKLVRMDYSDMYAGAFALSEILQEERGGAGTFLAVIWMEQSPGYLQALMGVLLAGGIAVPVHPRATKEEVRELCRFLEAELVIVPGERISAFNSSGGLTENIPYPAAVMDGECGVLQRLHPHGLRAMITRSYSPPPETSVIFMSSGSTGKPKGILLSDRNMLSNVRSIQEYIHLTADDRVLLTKSFGYSSTITGEWLLALDKGADLFLFDGVLHPLELIRLVKAHGITFMCTVPSAVIPWMKSSLWKKEDLATLERMIIVGGAVPPDTLLELKKRIPWVDIMPSYGLTEASPRVSYLPAEELWSRPGSAGIPVPGVEITVRRPDGGEADPEEQGEIFVTGPNVMLGYYNMPERTGETLTPLGLRTRDLGCKDQEGFLYVSGRGDTALNAGGHTVYPEQIEAVLAAHPAVGSVGVTSYTAEEGERLAAFVEQADGSAVEAGELCEELYAYVRSTMSPMYRPKEIRIVSGLPVTNSGKLDRAALRIWAMECERIVSEGRIR